VASNVSPPALFRVIEELQPTLLIDEADTFLHANEPLRGILNSGYTRKTAFVLRVIPQPGDLARSASPPNGSAPAGQMHCLASFSCWCPKAIARIGYLPQTLADRCIVLRMQRKTSDQKCERLRHLQPEPLKRQCARFVLDHADTIAAAEPELPPELNDRAADIWEPLFVLADLAGGDWPRLARQAALGLTTAARQNSPLGSLVADLDALFVSLKVDRLFSSEIVTWLKCLPPRPWWDLLNGKPLTGFWLAQQLRPCGICPCNLRIGINQAKGYLAAQFRNPSVLSS
jgi:hypothetical protein